MNGRYRHLLSPIMVGNVMLKTRMISTIALPHFLQGPELFPAEPIIVHLANIAKNGAAIVNIWAYTDSGQRTTFVEDGKRFPMFDITDPSVGNYFSQLADAIHFYDSKVFICMTPIETPGFEPKVTPGNTDMLSMFGVGDPAKVTHEHMDGMIEEAVNMCRFYQSVGFDGTTIQMGYREHGGEHIGMSKFLSPLSNKRTDEYGGNIENRARYPLEMCRSIKEACGHDFLVAALISGEEEAGGTTAEDTAKFAKFAEGNIDILQIRAGSMNANHPTGFNSIEHQPVTLHVAEAIKKRGANIITAPEGGYQNLDDNESFIASGKTDMIAMGRAFICDPEYGIKAYEGRGEDVVPCIGCAKCHVPYMNGPWLFMCSVNPVAGQAVRINRLVEVPKSAKKVAVIGGGPAGMEAALVAAERGHKVTLYEKNSYLGGLLHHADYSSFKWPLRNFKNYLLRQINMSGVTVFLNTEGTPELLAKEKYDAVLAALGSEPIIPAIPGIAGKNVVFAQNVYGNEKELAKDIVIIGGGEVGVETGMHLAEKGHRITILEMLSMLAPDAVQIHYYGMMKEAWEKLPNFKYILKARCTGISDGKVNYVDAVGKEHEIAAGSVVVAAGFKPRRKEALKYYDLAGRFFVLGDCNTLGNVQKSMRSAFAAASQI